MATHDARNVVSVFAGLPLSGGYAKDEYLNIEQTNDSYSIQVGSTGEVCRTRMNDRSGMATVSLQGSSLLNDAMSTILELDRLTNAGVGPFMAKDLNSLALAISPDAWIKKPPAMVYSGAEVSDVAWPIQLTDVEMFIAGQLT